jgi:hypothetical protein
MSRASGAFAETAHKVYSRVMMPDAKWLDALKLPLRVNVAVALICVALLALNLSGLLDLAAVHSLTLPVLTILAVTFCVLTLVGCVDRLFAPARERAKRSLLAARRDIRRREEEERQEAGRRRVLDRLDHLSEGELDRLVRCILDKSPSFVADSGDPSISLLVGKGFVWSPGGFHDFDKYPFSIHDFVWEALRKRKYEFIRRHTESKRAVTIRVAAPQPDRTRPARAEIARRYSGDSDGTQ